MRFNIAPTIVVNPGDAIPDLTTLQGTVDFATEKLRLSVNNIGALRVILADNAFIPGATCPTLTFLSYRRGVSIWEMLDKLLNGITPQNIRAYATEIERRHPRQGKNNVLHGIDGQRAFRSDRSTSRVFFTPAVGSVPRLERVPAKWSIEPLIQVLANAQCSEVVKRKPYIREAISPLTLLEELMELDSFEFGKLSWRWLPATRTVSTIGWWGGVHSEFALNF